MWHKRVNEVTPTWGKSCVLLGPSVLFVGLISFHVECIVGCLWRARCLDPRGATASSRLEVGFNCVKVISVSGKSVLVSEKTAIGDIGKCAPGINRSYFILEIRRKVVYSIEFPIYCSPPRSQLFFFWHKNLTPRKVNQ